MTMRSADESAAWDKMTLAASTAGATIRRTSAVVPCRARCWAISAPGISLLLGRSPTMTTSTAFDRSRIGMASPMARGAAAIPANHDALELGAAPVNVGHDQHRPARVEQGCLEN